MIRKALRRGAKGVIYSTLSAATAYTLAYLWWRSLRASAVHPRPEYESDL